MIFYKKLLYRALNNLIKKEGIEMMAMFFAQRVILGKLEFKKVPNVLKEEVKEILIESGLESLVGEE